MGPIAVRWKYWILVGWLGVFAVAVIASGPLFDRLATVDNLDAGAESARAQARIEQVTADGPTIFAVITGMTDYSAELNDSVAGAGEDVRAMPGVVEVSSTFTPVRDPTADRRGVLITVQLAENLDDEALEDAIVTRLHRIAAPSILVGGDRLAERAFGTQATRDLALGESVAFAFLIVTLILFLSSLLAAALPLLVAVVGVGVTLLALYGVSTFTIVGEYSLNIVTLLGIGLAVDYSLLIVARFREQRATGDDVPAAITTAMSRAGRAVVISGLAVAAAMAGLAAFAEPLFASMALGGTLAVLLTTALALTAIPAMLAVVGGRIRPAQPRPWLAARTTRFAQRRPVPVAIAATLGLLVLALPLLDANFANSDVRALPASVPERAAYDAYQEIYGEGVPEPVTVVADVDPNAPEMLDYLNRLTYFDGVSGVTMRPGSPPGVSIIDLRPHGTTGGPESRTLVRALRDQPPPFAVLVGGDGAEVADYQDSVADRLPLLVGWVALAMFVLLVALTRSVVVPLKALLLNALTLLSSLGVLVAVFQWGWGEPVLRFDSWDAVDLTTPLLLFVFIFGLSMDYEVFLLARIKEEYDRSGNNDAAVLRGITASGPVVTAAAACMTVVFAGFVVGGLVPVKEIGVGMAVALLLDVTVVRGLLLPATMTLLGDRNWWPGTPPRTARDSTTADRTAAAGRTV
ncbi:MMPL family transporter [Actinoplanes solisilvae]|uniref:MMPL family transporter n=1 Tax=Actinoplanes solisilvae TaxID=2486853 RepID=UPI000FD7484F|nr:efflux RND transporter permease subunit [Actinoplanes solisilvae]